MMRRITAFLVCLLLLLTLVLPAQAAQDNAVPYISDTEGLLSDAQVRSLEAQAEALSDTYECAVYVVTVDDYTDYGSGSVYEVAKAIYQANDLGWGEEHSGVMLLLSMAERDYSLIAYGYGNTAFTDYGKDYLADQFLDDFRDDDWAAGFTDYLETCGQMLEAARNGKPVDVGAKPAQRGNLLGNLIPSFLLALVICVIWRSAAKKKVRRSSEAGSYAVDGGVQITLRDARYTHSTRTVRHIERSSGGTSIDSSGFSGKSGKF